MKPLWNYMRALWRINIRVALSDGKGFFLSLLFMVMNNLAWFMIWVLLLGAVGTLRGWGISDVARMAGVATFAYGLALAVFGGAWSMYREVTEGSLDVFLTYPKPVLLSMLLSKPDPESAGDMAAGMIMLFVFGQVSWTTGMMGMGYSIFVSGIILGITILLNSTVFWTDDRSGAMEQALDTFVQLSTMPLQGQPFIIKALLFTVFPVGFIAFFPADMMRSFAIWKLGLLGGVACGIIALSVYIFHRGLRRYTSGNQFIRIP